MDCLELESRQLFLSRMLHLIVLVFFENLIASEQYCLTAHTKVAIIRHSVWSTHLLGARLSKLHSLGTVLRKQTSRRYLNHSRQLLLRLFCANSLQMRSKA